MSSSTSTRSLGFLAALLVIMPFLGAVILAATRQAWFPQLEALGTGSIVPYALCSILLVGAGLTPTHAHSLVAGLLFGAVAGSLVALVTVTAGALVAYWVFASWSRSRAVEALVNRPRVRAVQQALVTGSSGRMVGLVSLVRLSPVMPFAGTNLLMAASGVRLIPFSLGTVLGLAPRVIAVSVAGAGLAELDLRQAADIRLAIFGGAMTVLSLFVLGRIARRALQDHESSRAQPPESL